MAKILLLLGGNYHDFMGFSALLTPLLQSQGHQVELTYQPDSLLTLTEQHIDLVLMFTCLGNSNQNGRIAPELPVAPTTALIDWVAQGGKLLAAHSATVISAGNEPLRKLIGGAFISHPPQFAFTVYPMFQAHPITQGIEAFSVFDEFYIQSYSSDVDVHLAAFDRGVCYPMAWSKQAGQGRVAHIAIGHGPKVWHLAPYQKLVLQAVDWLIS